MPKKIIRHDGFCPIERVLDVFGGKWKPAVINALEEEGVLRFNELRRALPDVSQRMLTKQLRELERDGIVSRRHFPDIPPRVEYSLTELGESLRPIGRALDAWGAEKMPEVEEARLAYDRTRVESP
ncbi:MAG: helix-turn-helix domain-containing protein [Acidobacteriota bacterium]